jgi:hypothetical protein
MYVEAQGRVSSCIAQTDLSVSVFPPMSFTTYANFSVRQMTLMFGVLSVWFVSDFIPVFRLRFGS